MPQFASNCMATAQLEKLITEFTESILQYLSLVFIPVEERICFERDLSSVVTTSLYLSYIQSLNRSTANSYECVHVKNKTKSMKREKEKMSRISAVLVLLRYQLTSLQGC